MNLLTIVAHPLRQGVALGIARRFVGVTSQVADPSKVPVHEIPESVRLVCPQGTVLAEGPKQVYSALCVHCDQVSSSQEDSEESVFPGVG